MSASSSFIITCARSWLGTRFHHQGRCKRKGESLGGCDCIGLIIGVLDEAGITLKGKPPIQLDQLDYGMYPRGNRLKTILGHYFQVIPVQAMAEGDIILFLGVVWPQHVGFVAHYPGDKKSWSMIHCDRLHGCVVEQRIDDVYAARLCGVYRV